MSVSISVFSRNQRQSEEAHVYLIAGILRAIAQDLKAGLEGKSGGVTTQMYESYLGLIQTCGGLIYQLSMQIEADTYLGIFSVIVEVINNLRDILRTHTLEDAALFRSSLIMAISEFPSLLRYLSRNSVMTHALDPTHFMEPENGLLTGLFDDCLFILSRWSSLRDPNSVPWEDIAGRIHTQELNERRTAACHSDVCNLQPLHSTKQDEHYNCEATLHHVEVALRTKELWSWALSCAFVALEEKWLDSYQATLPRTCHDKKSMEYGCLEMVQSFLSSRHKDLHMSLLKMSTLFSSSTSTMESRIQPVALDMLAMNLPSAPRLRFCHLIATVTRVLIHSIRQLCSYLNSDMSQTSSNLMKIYLMEALSISCAWLFFEDQKADFTVGTFRWLSILRRKRPPEERPSKRIDAAELVPWITKASLLIRDLHAALRNLERALSRNSKLDLLEDAVRMFFSGGLVDLTRLSIRKLRLLELTMPSEYSAPSLPDFPSLKEIKRVKKKRSRRSWSHVRLKKRAATQIARSRNRIVNAFMNLDMKTGEKDGASSDAFVDLEDFLVDG